MSEYKLKDLNEDFFKSMGFKFLKNESTKLKKFYRKGSGLVKRSIKIKDYDIIQISIYYPKGYLAKFIDNYNDEKDVIEFIKKLETENLRTKIGYNNIEEIFSDAKEKWNIR